MLNKNKQLNGSKLAGLCFLVVSGLFIFLIYTYEYTNTSNFEKFQDFLKIIIYCAVSLFAFLQAINEFKNAAFHDRIIKKLEDK